jgi:hypothetical protein
MVVLMVVYGCVLLVPVWTLDGLGRVVGASAVDIVLAGRPRGPGVSWERFYAEIGRVKRPVWRHTARSARLKARVRRRDMVVTGQEPSTMSLSRRCKFSSTTELPYLSRPSSSQLISSTFPRAHLTCCRTLNL